MSSLREFKAVYAEWEKRVKEEGRLEGQRQTLRGLLGERFGPLPAEALARIADADSEALDRWLRRVLHARTLDDALAR